ncbi:hypothetical protein BDV18DRAFT_148018 [Aspergillus unguis]
MTCLASPQPQADPSKDETLLLRKKIRDQIRDLRRQCQEASGERAAPEKGPAPAIPSTTFTPDSNVSIQIKTVPVPAERLTPAECRAEIRDILYQYTALDYKRFHYHGGDRDLSDSEDDDDDDVDMGFPRVKVKGSACSRRKPRSIYHKYLEDMTRISDEQGLGGGRDGRHGRG